MNCYTTNTNRQLSLLQHELKHIAKVKDREDGIEHGDAVEAMPKDPPTRLTSISQILRRNP